MNLHLNEFLRRLWAWGGDDESVLNSIVFKRTQNDGMNIGPGTWRLVELNKDTARFRNEDGGEKVRWAISKGTGSLAIDSFKCIRVGRKVLNSKELFINLGSRHYTKSGEPW